MLESMLRFFSFHPEITIIGAITLIQISPIKIDPWGAMVRAIKKFLVGGIEDKLNEIARKVNSLEEQVEEDRALQARTHILRFADELYSGKHHSKEYFDDMLSDIDMYEAYCAAHPNFKNNKTVMSATLIKDTYHSLVESHAF